MRHSDLRHFNKAEEHYRKAFELMPSSFGRVESHCYGCEHAFSGKRAQNVAEKVFTQLAKNMPDKPQVFYLLGYLRDAQGLHSEAAESYRKAVKLDPDCLNAWKQLANTAEETGMSRPERETIAFELLRLDPAGHKTSPNFNEIVNLRMLWDTILKTEAVLPSTETGPLYALAASKTEIGKRGQDNRWSSWHYQTLTSRRMELRNKLVENALVRSTANLLEILSRSR